MGFRRGLFAACALAGCLFVAPRAFAQVEPKKAPPSDIEKEAPAPPDEPAPKSDRSSGDEPGKNGETPPPAKAKAATDEAADKSKDAAARKDRPLRDYLKLTVGPITFSPILLVQAQAAPYVGKSSFTLSGDPADTAGFRIQRARFGLEVNLANQGRGAVSVELGSREDGTARIHDAWLAYVGFPYAQIFAGAQTVPFSRSALIDSAGSALVDRPLAVRSMAPGHQVGIVGRGSVAEGAFSYDVGVFNGFHRVDQFYQGYGQNSAPFGNRFNGLAYVGRLGTEPVGKLSSTIADVTHESPRFGIGASYAYSDGGAAGVHNAGVDALLHAKGFHLLGEFLFSSVQPKSTPTQSTATVVKIQSIGAVAETGYMIVERLFGLNARFEYIDPNGSVDNEGDAFLIGGGASFQFLDGIFKTQAEFMHREERHGTSLQNDYLMLQGQISL